MIITKDEAGNKSIEFSATELNDIYHNKLEGYELEIDTENAEIDTGKCAWVDSGCSMYIDGIYVGSGKSDSYYGFNQDIDFNDSIIFKVEIVTEEDEFDSEIYGILESTKSIKTKIWKLKKLFDKYDTTN